MTKTLFASVAAYAASIVLANYMTVNYGLVNVGFGLLVTAGTFAAGFALLARDAVQSSLRIALTTEIRGRGHMAGVVAVSHPSPIAMALYMIAVIALGGALSWFLASPVLAVASTIAFIGAELVDLVVFTSLRERGFFRAAVASNVVGAPVDTVLFLYLAGFPLTWQAVAGQFIGKVFWATLIPLALFAAARWGYRKVAVVA